MSAPDQSNTPNTPASSPTRPARHLGWWALATIAMLTALLLAGLLALTASLSTAPGSAWLLRQLPGLVIEDASGSLLGDFSARRLSWRDTQSGTLVQLEGLRWQGLKLRSAPKQALRFAIEIDALQADRLLLDWKSSDTPSQAPSDLRLPLALQVHALRLAELQLKPLNETLNDLSASLDLSAQDGAQHQLQLLSLRRDRLRLSGQARLASDAGMEMDASFKAEQLLDAGPWQAQLQWKGPLAAGRVSAELRAAGQTLALQARITPFADWPLASLSASAQALDLQALDSRWPHTALSGQAQLAATAWDQPADLRLQLSNGLAGSWEQARLPLRDLQLDLQLQAEPRRQLWLKSLQARLGSAKTPAGEISAQGRAAADQAWQIDAKLSGLRPQALDARLADLNLGGSIKLQGRGLPGSPNAQPLQLQAALQGRLTTSPRESAAVALKLNARVDAQGVQLSEARLSGGPAAGELQAQGDFSWPQAARGWQTQFKLQAQSFDPRLLWRGAAGSPWQSGTQRLNATLDASLKQGDDAMGKTWPQGEATINIANSQLAGLPLSGTARYQRGAARGDLPQGQLQLDAAGLALNAKFSASAARDALRRLQLDLEAKSAQLATLAPWLQLAGVSAKLSGSVQADAHLRWERDDGAQASWRGSSEGQAALNGLSWQPGSTPALQMKAATLAWRAPLALTPAALAAPLHLQFELDQGRQGARQLGHAKIRLDGSLAEHRLQMEAQGQLGAAGWLQTLAQDRSSAGPNAAVAAALTLDLRGGLSTAAPPADGYRWSARLSQLQLRPDAKAATATTPAPSNWLEARDIDLALQFSPSTGLSELSLAPGQLQLAGAKLKWQEAQWRAARSQAEPAALALELQMDPLALAPVLARLQPDFGWGGNLMLGGRLSLHSRPSMELDVELLRASGDLSVTDERGVQALGLTDLRLALSAHQGLWQLTEAFAGTGMGALAGAVSARTSPQALWPSAATPIEGVLQANVARLGTWGGWVPTGWRLGGSLSASLSVAGTLAAPELSGQAQGEQLALRNTLLGVDVRDARFALRLKNSIATLEQFSAKAGGGTLSAQGQAQLGDKPSAQVQIEASRFALLSRVDRRMLVSGKTTLALNEDALQLDGELGVDEGLLDFSQNDAPALDADVRVSRASDSPSAVPGDAPPAVARSTRVDLKIQLGQNLKLRGHGIDTQLRGDLRLTQKDGRTALNGSVRTEGGIYKAYGQNLEIERGEFNFIGPIDNPRLDVLAVRPNTDTRVGVTVTGTAQQPRIKLYSDPDLSETEKLSWLLLGRSSDGLGRADTALLQRAAMALLSGEGESASGRLIKNLGLDELSLRQGEDDANGTIVRVGKQLSRRWFLGYERGLNATTGTWQLIYRIAQRFTLRAQSGDDSAVDLIWQWRWN